MKFLSYIIQDFFTFSGRINRLNYFYATATNYLLLFSIYKFLLNNLHSNLFILLFIVLLCLALSTSGLSINIRRLHDIDKSSWFLLISFIPFIGHAFLVYLFFAKGTVGPNKYGDEPIN